MFKLPRRMKFLSKLTTIILLIGLGFVIGYINYGSRPTITPFEGKSGLESFTVNSHFSNGEQSGEYLTFKIESPSKYIATSEGMVTPYTSQGGGAAPRLILSTSQISNFNDFQQILRSGQACIVIQSTIGWTTFEDWSNSSWLPSSSVQVLGMSTKKIGDFSVQLRKITNNDNGLEAVDALIKLPEGVGYYFRSCNPESAEDLENMLQTFDTAGSSQRR